MLAARFQNSSASASAAPTTPAASPTASSTRSTVPRNRLNMGSSSLVYNRLGGTSTSAISQAAVHRHTSAVPVSTSTPEDFYKLVFSMDQTKIEKSLLIQQQFFIL